MAETALVIGLGVSGEAVARHLRERGARVIVTDDAPSDTTRERAAAAGLDLVEAPAPAELRSLVAESDVVVPSPGVPEAHPALRAASELDRPVRSELELASRWARRPIVAVTGTNGKTTVTEMVAAMLRESGMEVVAAGNIGLPLSDAVRRDVDVIVAEVSSFQLRFTDSFRPAVAAWLNLAPDHLDWHPDLAAYAAAKARIWAFQEGGDVAVANADDPTVAAYAAHSPARLVTFATAGEADYRIEGDRLAGPKGAIVDTAELPRALPHDLANALAAAATASGAGATAKAVAATLRSFGGLAHRVTLVAEAGGLRWYDDSKATNPHAAAAAVRGFASVVLIAGGRNKGLDLGALAGAADHVRAVVAIGEAAPEVRSVFAGLRPVEQAESMEHAVELAAGLARPGDAVLLSPACASFDAYRSYSERGDHFARAVRERIGGERA